MSELKDGGPAFPGESKRQTTTTPTRTISTLHPGMSLRDWFAGQVITGLMIAPIDVNIRSDKAAEFAYAMADAMLLARTGGSHE